SLEAFAAEVELARGAHRLLDEHWSRTQSLLAQLASADDGAAAGASARRLAEDLALALQGALLLRHAPSTVAEACIGARLGADRGHLYGVLPRGSELAASLARL